MTAPAPLTLGNATRQSLTDSAIEILRAELARGRWKIGERIPTEPELAGLLGVGRNTVREAVRVMVHAGLLETRQGAGTFVRAQVEPSAMLRRVERAGLRDYVELRATLEIEASRLAAARRTDEDLRRLRAALEYRGERHDALALDEFVRRDVDFHIAVVEATHNLAMVELYRYFAVSLQAQIEASYGDAALPEPDYAAHAAVLDAIAAGDPDRAGEAARALLQPLQDTLNILLSGTT